MGGIIGVYAKEKITEKILQESTCTGGIFNNDECIEVWNDDSFVIMHSDSKKRKFINEKDCVIFFDGNFFNADKLKTSATQIQNMDDLDMIYQLYLNNGVDFLKQIDGEFVIVIYDKNQRKMYLCRDKMGTKPLYYTIKNRKLYFGTEIKFFKAYSDISFNPNIERISCDLFLGLWSSKHQTYFEKIYSIEAGEYLCCENNKLSYCTYWNLMNDRDNEKNSCNYDVLQDVIERAVKCRLYKNNCDVVIVCDGFESLLVAAIVAKNTQRMVKVLIPDDYRISSEWMQKMKKLYPNITYVGNLQKRQDLDYDTVSLLSYIKEGVLWRKESFHLYNEFISIVEKNRDCVFTDQGAAEAWLGHYFSYPHYRFDKDELFDVDYMYNYFLSNMNGEDTDYTEIVKDNVRKQLKQIIKNYLSRTDDMLNNVACWEIKTSLQESLVDINSMVSSFDIIWEAPLADSNVIEKAFNINGKWKVIDNRTEVVLRNIALVYLHEEPGNIILDIDTEKNTQYNLWASIYLKKNWSKVRHNKYMKKIFAESFFDSYWIRESAYDTDFTWYVCVLYIFFTMFDNSGYFGNEKSS